MCAISSWGWPHPLNWKSITFTRTCLEPLMTEIHPVSKLLSIGMLYCFYLRYITFSKDVSSLKYEEFFNQIWIYQKIFSHFYCSLISDDAIRTQNINPFNLFFSHAEFVIEIVFIFQMWKFSFLLRYNSIIKFLPMILLVSEI